MIYLCVVLRIITHIERVLLVNDCVIVPDFGGFVLRRCPALFVAEENAFSPAHNEIVFNPALNHAKPCSFGRDYKAFLYPDFFIGSLLDFYPNFLVKIFSPSQ